MEHAFNVNIAVENDVNLALLIHHFKYWTFNNLANKRNIHEGLCWTYNTIQAFCETFPYWTRHQIEHLIKKAESQGLIVCGNYNQNKYDRTKWYALTPKSYHFYEELQSDAFIERLYSSISSDGKMHKCLYLPISENSEMEFGNFRNLFRKIPKPIPDTIPDTKPYILNPLIPLKEKATEKKKVDWGSRPKPQKFQDKKKLVSLSIDEMLNDNPHFLTLAILEEWLTYRKKPITKRVWNQTNSVLSQLHSEHGIKPQSAFERMLEKQWQGIELSYFDDVIRVKKKNISNHDTDYLLDDKSEYGF